jgi:hypothetical protein
MEGMVLLQKMTSFIICPMTHNWNLYCTLANLHAEQLGGAIIFLEIQFQKHHILPIQVFPLQH